MAIKRQEDVIELQISVHDAILMEIFQSKTDFCSIKSILVSLRDECESFLHLLGALGTELSSLNMQHQIASTNVFHDEVNPSLRLETCVQVQQKWMAFLVGDQEHSLF